LNARRARGSDKQVARRALCAAGNRRDVGQQDFTFWTILLRAASAYHSYRRVFPQHIDPKDVARFLIFDARLPRSIAFCLGEMQAMIELLRRNFGLRHAAAAAEQVSACSDNTPSERRRTGEHLIFVLSS
jgi:uncharacterized alpha-E superfamily protein